MDTMISDLNYRISQLDDEGLIKMINNHLEYRQEAIDLTMQELTRRKIPFISPPAKPMRAIKKEKLSSLILHASVGIASLSVKVSFFIKY